MNSFQEFIDAIIVESLHPELQSIVTAKGDHRNKLPQIALKIKDLTARGHKTGIEGNMPKGSSRAYLAHSEQHPVEIDGHQTAMRTGIKVAIKSSLERHHDAASYDGMSLGNLQNQAEGGDHFVNSSYRTLVHDDTPHPTRPRSSNPPPAMAGNKPKFKTNEDGIFPPLIDHDHEHHEWSHVGHVDDVTGIGFRKHTKCESHPQGITHKDFCDTLTRRWNQDHGKHWKQSPENESRMDHVEKHPLVERFLNHQGDTYTPPHDYTQMKNMGVWTHPVHGTKHIVARDLGFNQEVSESYRQAMTRKYTHHAAMGDHF